MIVVRSGKMHRILLWIDVTLGWLNFGMMLLPIAGRGRIEIGWIKLDFNVRNWIRFSIFLHPLFSFIDVKNVIIRKYFKTHLFSSIVGCKRRRCEFFTLSVWFYGNTLFDVSNNRAASNEREISNNGMYESVYLSTTRIAWIRQKTALTTRTSKWDT